MPIHLLTRKPCLCGQQPQSEITTSTLLVYNLTLYMVTETIVNEGSVKGKKSGYNKVATLRIINYNQLNY